MSQSCGPSKSTTASQLAHPAPPQTQRSWFGPESPNAASRKKRPRPPPPPLSTRLNHMMLSTSNSTYSQNPHPPLNNNNTTTCTPPINPYHVLQIRRDATNAEIRDAYRRLALWHHPGRGKCLGLDEEELQRRFAIFDMVAACYETLMDRESRYACDQLIKRLEVSRIAQHLPMAGELHVGGQRFWTGPAIQLQQQQLSVPKPNSQDKQQQQQPSQGSDVDGIPSLSRVSSHSSTDEQPDLEGPQGSESNCNPSFLDKLMPPCGSRKVSSRPSKDDYEEEEDDDFDAPSVSTSSTTTMDVIHYSESETNRLFGGSLALLHQARQWKPFTDPHEVFEQVFGAHMFPIQRFPRTPQYNSTPPMTPASPTKNGSSRTLIDGTRISTSSRIIQHRQLTRIEKVVTTPQGRRQLVISVSSEDHSGNPTSPTNSNYYSPKGVDPKRPLMVAVSSSDEEPTNFFCLSQDWLVCPFGGENSC